MGHRSSIKSLTFHPCGNFIATGSSDTNVKVSPPLISSLLRCFCTSAILVSIFSFSHLSGIASVWLSVFVQYFLDDRL